MERVRSSLGGGTPGRKPSAQKQRSSAPIESVVMEDSAGFSFDALLGGAADAHYTCRPFSCVATGPSGSAGLSVLALKQTRRACWPSEPASCEPR